MYLHKACKRSGTYSLACEVIYITDDVSIVFKLLVLLHSFELLFQNPVFLDLTCQNLHHHQILNNCTLKRITTMKHLPTLTLSSKEQNLAYTSNAGHVKILV